MKAYDDNESFDDIKALLNHEKIIELIDSSDWNDSDKKKALIAAIFYQAIENIKGEYAFYLEKQLRENLSKKDKREAFSIPIYISDSIKSITS